MDPTGPHRIGPAAAVVLDMDGTLVEWPVFLNAEFEAARARALGRIRALFPAAAAADPPIGHNNRELLDALAPALGPAELGAARRLVFAAGALAVVDGPHDLARLLVPACAERARRRPLTEARARARAGPGLPGAAPDRGTHRTP